jgi:tetratricopeptide (TPR) repeat protein
MSRLEPSKFLIEVTNFEFLNITQKVLVDNSDYSLYDDIYSYMMESMDEGDVKNEIAFNYGIMRGKAFMGQYRFKEALQVFEMSFALNPRHLELQTLMLSALTYTFRNSSNQEIIRIIQDYSERFEELNSNGMFISIQMLAYLSYAEEMFDFNYGEEGLQYLLKFEELYTANPQLDIDYNQVGNSYSAAAVYYFKRYDKLQARRFLERGLEIAPDNYELTYRLQSI